MDVVIFAQHLYKVLRERTDALKEQLEVGFAKDYAGYKHMVGEIQGLQLAINECKALLEKDTDEEDTYTGQP